LRFPQLGEGSDEESDGEDWNEDWDIMSVQELPWNSCKLPHIHDSDFPYYPRGDCVQVLSRFSDESESGPAENIAEIKDVVLVEIEEKKKVGLRRWCKDLLHKLKSTVRK